jgi:hypothetical protein
MRTFLVKNPCEHEKFANYMHKFSITALSSSADYNRNMFLYDCNGCIGMNLTFKFVDDCQRCHV